MQVTDKLRATSGQMENYSLNNQAHCSLIKNLSFWLGSDFKVHYATFLRAVNRHKNRVLDARNSCL